MNKNNQVVRAMSYNMSYMTQENINAKYGEYDFVEFCKNHYGSSKQCTVNAIRKIKEEPKLDILAIQEYSTKYGNSKYSLANEIKSGQTNLNVSVIGKLRNSFGALVSVCTMFNKNKFGKLIEGTVFNLAMSDKTNYDKKDVRPCMILLVQKSKNMTKKSNNGNNNYDIHKNENKEAYEKFNNFGKNDLTKFNNEKENAENTENTIIINIHGMHFPGPKTNRLSNNEGKARRPDDARSVSGIISAHINKLPSDSKIKQAFLNDNTSIIALGDFNDRVKHYVLYNGLKIRVFNKQNNKNNTFNNNNKNIEESEIIKLTIPQNSFKNVENIKTCCWHSEDKEPEFGHFSEPGDYILTNDKLNIRSLYIPDSFKGTERFNGTNKTINAINNQLTSDHKPIIAEISKV